MFQRLRIWLAGESGLKQAAREAARQATREGMIEGWHDGVGDFIEHVTGIRAEPQTIEVKTSNGNGNGHSLRDLTSAELRGLRKADLLELAETRGIEADDSWTVTQLREELVSG